ncbi:hypothetical protein C7H75_25320 (plasmid) [Prescottella equi]|nr:hypothetical protein C7H75_25320 [Prescottella equi]
MIGVASAVFFLAMVMCFRARAYQIAHADRGDERLSMDPMRPAEDPRASARYLMNYRGICSRPVRARKPRAASGQMSGGTGAARTSVAADPDVRALSQ